MTDSYGALELPAPAPNPHFDQAGKRQGNEAVGDPCLTRLVDYFQAFTNAMVTDAWHAVSPRERPVESAFTHDPNEVVFSTNDLPAYFLFRQGDESALERLANDIDIEHSKLRLLWVFPPRAQDDRKLRYPFVNAIVKSLIRAIEVGRHPSYVLAGDPDVTAEEFGSVIYRVANIFKINWRGYKLQPVIISMDSGTSRARDGAQGEYMAVDAHLELQERCIMDTAVDFPTTSSPSQPGGGNTLTITTPDKARDLAVAKF